MRPIKIVLQRRPRTCVGPSFILRKKEAQKHQLLCCRFGEKKGALEYEKRREAKMVGYLHHTRRSDISLYLLRGYISLFLQLFPGTLNKRPGSVFCSTGYGNMYRKTSFFGQRQGRKHPLFHVGFWTIVMELLIMGGGNR